MGTNDGLGATCVSSLHRGTRVRSAPHVLLIALLLVGGRPFGRCAKAHVLPNKLLPKYCHRRPRRLYLSFLHLLIIL